MLDWKRLALLALVTFCEAALGSLVGFSVLDINVNVLVLAVAGGAGAVLSLAYNVARVLKAKLDLPELTE